MYIGELESANCLNFNEIVPVCELTGSAQPSELRMILRAESYDELELYIADISRKCFLYLCIWFAAPNFLIGHENMHLQQNIIYSGSKQALL